MATEAKKKMVRDEWEGGDVIQGDSAQCVRRPSGVTAWAAGQSLKSEELRQRGREGVGR